MKVDSETAESQEPRPQSTPPNVCPQAQGSCCLPPRPDWLHVWGWLFLAPLGIPLVRGLLGTHVTLTDNIRFHLKCESKD